MTSAKTTICFDLDGTLVDTAPDLFNALDHALDEQNLPPANRDAIRPIIGFGAKAMIRRALEQENPGTTPGDSQINMMWQSLIGHYTIHIADQSRPFDGALPALKALRADGHLMAICTNKPLTLTVSLLQKLGLIKYFAAISGADSFEFKKPDARHLQQTVLNAGGDPLNAIMVGDSKTDIETARNANAPVIGVDFGYTDKPMRDLAPDRLISHFDELQDAIASLDEAT